MKGSKCLGDADHLLWRISHNEDEDAFRKLFEFYYASLCLYARRYVEDINAREDIVQDVFFSVWEKRKSIAPHTSAENYLVVSVKNNCLNYLRGQGYLHDYRDRVVENLPPYATQVDELYSLQELEELLEKALAKLPEEYRLAFILSRQQDKSSKEIAEIMGISVRTVERYRNRAIELLKNDLKDYLPIAVLLSLL